jgi:hypothetical protein
MFQPVYLGIGDLHDQRFNDTKRVVPLYKYSRPDVTPYVDGHCQYSFVVYASQEFQDSKSTSLPLLLTIVVAITFALVVVTFFVYDVFVQRRNKKVVDAATRSTAILSSMFPSNIRARLFAEREAKESKAKGSKSYAAKNRLRSFLDDGGSDDVDAKENENLGYAGTPIADLFPETTIMFADIAGFTAWSSVREPCQVFTLLESLYKSFDDIAKRRRVFKVETVGDCYVAVTGLPDPRKDHAIVMARFARDCMAMTRTLVKKLEVSLGP